MKRKRLTLVLAPTLSLIATLALRGETYEQWVASHFTPAEIAAGFASPACDGDEDSCPNLFEYFGGTHPLDASSAFGFNLALDPFLNEVTVHFSPGPDCEDADYLVHVSDDLIHWSPGAIHVTNGPVLTYHLNGHRFVRIGVRSKPGVMLDSDGDGLDDFFEESLVDADPEDGMTHIGEILPSDDFDGDGTLNIDEEANRAAPTHFAKPAALDPGMVTGALDTAPAASPTGLVVHTELK